MEYQICIRCIMDTSDLEIEFDSQGYCNHCNEYINKYGEKIKPHGYGKETLDRYLSMIKGQSRDLEFDCILGVSGGVDSSYLAYLTKEWGLRPLAFHLDNGWNSELAVSNIESLLNKLEIELETFIIDWEEFRDLQVAYLKASVIDVEVLTDHAILAGLYQCADSHGVRFILNGSNIVTESILPRTWNFRSKNDIKNIMDINNNYGKREINTFPLLGYKKEKYYIQKKNIRMLSLLNYVDYQKHEAMDILSKELDWHHYSTKHGESLFTKFYQNYILPTKFKVDKRRAHLSTLICSDQISRERALKVMDKELYESQELAEDYDYVIKKLGLKKDEFEGIMKLPVMSHFYYKTDWYSKFQYYIIPRIDELYTLKKFYRFIRRKSIV